MDGEQMGPPYYPPPYYWPGYNQPQQSGGRLTPSELSHPTRVDKAIEVLTLCIQKTLDRAVRSGEYNIVELHGKELVEEEKMAQLAAAKCLQQYFQGKLRPNEWEKQQFEVMRQRLEQEVYKDTVPGRVVLCPLCTPNPPAIDCIFCAGSGRIVVTPAGHLREGDPRKPEISEQDPTEKKS